MAVCFCYNNFTFNSIYPNQIWIQEKADRDESRFRMRTISNASEFYKEITGNYTINGPQMFELVEAAIDSAFADSLFVGSNKLY